MFKKLSFLIIFTISSINYLNSMQEDKGKELTILEKFQQADGNTLQKLFNYKQKYGIDARMTYVSPKDLMNKTKNIKVLKKSHEEQIFDGLDQNFAEKDKEIGDLKSKLAFAECLINGWEDIHDLLKENQPKVEVYKKRFYISSIIACLTSSFIGYKYLYEKIMQIKSKKENVKPASINKPKK